MAPDRVGDSNMYNVLEGEYFIDEVTQKKVSGPLTVRVIETEYGILRVQGAEEGYEVPGKKMEDFPAAVMKD